MAANLDESEREVRERNDVASLIGVFEEIMEDIVEATVKYREARRALAGHLGYSRAFPADCAAEGHTLRDHQMRLLIAREQLDLQLYLFSHFLVSDRRSEVLKLFSSKAAYKQPANCVRDKSDYWTDISMILGAWESCSGLVDFDDGGEALTILNQTQTWHIADERIQAIIASGATLITLIKAFWKKVELAKERKEWMSRKI